MEICCVSVCVCMFADGRRPPASHNDMAWSLFPALFHPYCLPLSQVMRETDTQVKWPSKLKIGAKSKKGESQCLFYADCGPTCNSSVKLSTLFLSRSTCEGGGNASQCVRGQEDDPGSSGNKGAIQFLACVIVAPLPLPFFFFLNSNAKSR